MEFKHLEVFVKLVENLSFSAAAEELNISQPTVSLHIKQLEEELDTNYRRGDNTLPRSKGFAAAAFNPYRSIYQSKPKDIADRLIYHSNRLYSPLCIEPVQKDAPQYSYSS